MKITKTSITVYGTVQGVGFRPFVYRLAHELGLTGLVRNQGGIVQIEIYGHREQAITFVSRLRSEAPPLSVVKQVYAQETEETAPAPEEFLIRDSRSDIEAQLEVPVDSATCQDCLNELWDVQNRRYRYPFINCTNCGPRFTIVESLPYDRASTTMKCFPMCSGCLQEYNDPHDRRFHAQSNGCFDCGPKLTYKSVAQSSASPLLPEGEAAIRSAIQLLAGGGILAVKSLGGFHLACNAFDPQSLDRLRSAKRRESKPFAVMFPNIDSVRESCLLTEPEVELLLGAVRPIVLLNKGDHNKLPEQIAPGVCCIGALLPYTPLQHLLLTNISFPLVMTSGNESDEPIAIRNREAVARISTIADGFLLNNRDISSRCDDSVSRVLANTSMVIRRARGYAPAPIKLPVSIPKTVLAVGGHLKSTFCIANGNQAYLSQHLGDLDHIETVDHFEESLTSFIRIFHLTPEIVACDMHPDYGTNRLIDRWRAGRGSCPFDFSKISHIFPIQHHFAHIVGCMAENQVEERVIGVALDGIGYGADGHLWGGEFLSCSFNDYVRHGHFKYVGMPGGEAAIREPWRMAIAHLEQIGSSSDSFFAGVSEQQVKAVKSQLESGFNVPMTSSCGRLFDAVSAILGLCYRSRYEGEAAVLLENLANSAFKANDDSVYDFARSSLDNRHLLDMSPTFKAVLEDRKRGVNVALIAMRFHRTIAKSIEDMCIAIRNDTGIGAVCLSGGVFQNAVLTELASQALSGSGFRVMLNRLVPPNDGGLSLGQAVAAGAQLVTQAGLEKQVNRQVDRRSIRYDDC